MIAVAAPPPTLAPPLDPAIPAALAAVRADLNAILIDRDEAIWLALCALLARQHMVLLGPPGTAKSLLVEELAKRIGARCFSLLMTRFTTPEEVFGPVSVAGMKADEYRRVIAGMLPEAEIAFLDEIWKSNSAILNALLRIVNERRYKNGGADLPVPLLSLFAASNELPQADDLAALWDRLPVRYVVGYADDAGFGRLLRLPPPGPPAAVIDPATLAAAQVARLSVALPDPLLAAVEQLRRDLAGDGIVVSDRRWRAGLALLQAAALLDGRDSAEEDDLAILAHVCWQQPDQQPRIARACGRLANPLNQRAQELGDEARSVYDLALSVQKLAGKPDAEKMLATTEALAKLRAIRESLGKVQKQAGEEGRPAAKIAATADRVTRWRGELAAYVTD